MPNLYSSKAKANLIASRLPGGAARVAQLQGWSGAAREKLPPSRSAKRTPSGRAIPAVVLDAEKAKRESQPQPKKPVGSARFMQGRVLPGHEDRGRVNNVVRKGDNRVVYFENGTRMTLPKKKYVKRFREALRAHGFKSALKSMRTDPETGKTKVILGGEVRGDSKEYSSVGKAKAALRRRFKQPAA